MGRWSVRPRFLGIASLAGLRLGFNHADIRPPGQGDFFSGGELDSLGEGGRPKYCCPWTDRLTRERCGARLRFRGDSYWCEQNEDHGPFGVDEVAEDPDFECK